MKKIFTVIFALCLAGTSAFAAIQVKNFAAAQKRAPKDGILVYFYGPDWDARSTAMLKTFWGNADVKTLAAMPPCSPFPCIRIRPKKKKNASRTHAAE